MDLAITSPHHLSHKRIAGLLLFGMCAFFLMPQLSATERQNRPHRESKRADTREIEALESDWRGAMVKGDAGALESLLADDFFGISANGTISDKRQYLDRVAERRNNFSNIELIDVKVRMQPTIAIAVSKARVSGALDGHPFNGIFRYTKVYGRVAGRWRVLNFEATRVSGADDDASEMFRGLPLAPATPAAPATADRR